MSHAEIKRHAVAVIGIGSPFGDDRLGWLAVEQLEQSTLRRRYPGLALTFAPSDRPGALLLEQLHDVDAAILIDAMQAGVPPGTVRSFTPEQLGRQATGLLSSHAFGVAQSLALAATLGRLPQYLLIIGIEMGADAAALTLAPHTVQQLVRCVEQFLESMPCSADAP